MAGLPIIIVKDSDSCLNCGGRFEEVGYGLGEVCDTCMLRRLDDGSLDWSEVEEDV